jgi:hypothetical protein
MEKKKKIPRNSFFFFFVFHFFFATPNWVNVFNRWWLAVVVVIAGSAVFAVGRLSTRLWEILSNLKSYIFFPSSSFLFVHSTPTGSATPFFWCHINSKKLVNHLNVSKRKNKNLSATICWPTKRNCQRIKEKGKFLWYNRQVAVVHTVGRH